MGTSPAVVLHVGLCTLLLCCCSPSAAVGKDAYTEEGFPDPGFSLEWAACGVKNRSNICDPSNRLTGSELNRLNILIQSLRDVDTCLCDKNGPCHRLHEHTIKVALVPRIKYASGGFPQTSDAEIKAVRSFAEHLRDDGWNFHVGVSCPLVAVIVLDLHTNRIWTATNRYARKVITDDRAEEVGLSAKDKYFKQGMIYLGLDDMISKYKEFLEEGPPGLAWWAILLIVLGSLAGGALVICFCCCVCSGGGGGGGGGVWGGGGGGGGGGGCGGGGGGGGGGGCGGGGGG